MSRFSSGIAVKPAHLAYLEQLPLDVTQVAVLHGVGRYFGLNHSPATVCGASGYAFVINIKRDLCPSGPLIWRRHCFNRLVVNLGIRTEDVGFFTSDTPRERRRAVDAELRSALDQGLPCALCNDEFQLITGYDERGFFTIGPYPDHLHRRLTFDTWEEWGDDVYAYFYIYRAETPAERIDLVRASLEFAVDLFRHPDAFAYEDYGVGPRAYENWLHAAEDHGGTFGAAWNATVWSECRRGAAEYVTEIGTWFPAVAGVTTALAGTYTAVSNLLAEAGDAGLGAVQRCHLVSEAHDLETAAVEQLEALLAVLPAGNMARATIRPANSPDAPPLLAEVVG